MVKSPDPLLFGHIGFVWVVIFWGRGVFSEPFTNWGLKRFENLSLNVENEFDMLVMPTCFQ